MALGNSAKLRRVDYGLVGVRWCGNVKSNFYLHLMWGVLFALAGVVQCGAGIYFMMELPIFQLGSNIWTGAWNIFSAILICILCCTSGGLTLVKAQGLLLLSLVVIVVNLINLVILEVGEWRGFLTDEDRKYIDDNGLDKMMHNAYMSSTVATVTAMICAFLASQQTFCFLQVQTDQSIENKNRSSFMPSNMSNNNHVKSSFDLLDADDILTKDIVKRPNDGEDLNLKTPHGPEPHPSWVYRNSGTMNSQSSGNKVKRSLSLLGNKPVVDALKNQNKFDLLGTLTKGGTKKPKISSYVDLRNSQNINTISGKLNVNANNMRHAVIRRHQSMYIHPRATSEIQPSFSSPNQQESPYKLHEVSGKSEIRPIVTLQRSKTTAGTMSNGASLHYRSTSIQGLHRNTFNAVSRGVMDYNNYRKNLGYSRTFANTDELCEFQAGKSFDLPDMDKFRHRFHRNWNSTLTKNQSLVHPALGTHSRTMNYNYSRAQGSKEDAKSQYGHQFMFGDDLSSKNNLNSLDSDSCHGNVQYQAVEGFVQSSSKSDFKRKAHYSSLENLLETTASLESPSHNLLNRPHYGSTESISSHGSMSKRQSTIQTQTNDSLISDNSTDILYDIPKSNLQKSNSRVASVGRLRLRVESFRQMKHSSGTQTDLTVIKNENPNKYRGQFKKNPSTAPNKPIRKSKPNVISPANSNSGRRNSHQTDCSSNRSDRSASPDNSSTSGYSSPSAGLNSKDNSPYGSKIDDKASDESKQVNQEKDSDAADNGSKITVIQIIPANLNSSDLASDSFGGHHLEEPGSSVDEEELENLANSAVQEQKRIQMSRRQRESSPPHRELPRIATNGTLTKHKRRLPEATGPPHPFLAEISTLPRMNHSSNNNSGLNTINRRLLLRSNLHHLAGFRFPRCPNWKGLITKGNPYRQIRHRITV